MISLSNLLSNSIFCLNVFPYVRFMLLWVSLQFFLHSYSKLICRRQEDAISSSTPLKSSMPSRLFYVLSCAFVFNLSSLFLLKWDHWPMFPGMCPDTPPASPASNQPYWINKRLLPVCVCVCGFTSKKGVVKRQEWLRWRWHWLGSISNTSRSRTLYKHKYMHRHSSYTGLKEFLNWTWFCYTMPSYVWPFIKSASCLLKNKKSPHGCTLKNYTHIHRHTLHACMNTA